MKFDIFFDMYPGIGDSFPFIHDGSVDPDWTTNLTRFRVTVEVDYPPADFDVGEVEAIKMEARNDP
jgi:hypothetical protein